MMADAGVSGPLFVVLLVGIIVLAAWYSSYRTVRESRTPHDPSTRPEEDTMCGTQDQPVEQLVGISKAALEEQGYIQPLEEPGITPASAPTHGLYADLSRVTEFGSAVGELSQPDEKGRIFELGSGREIAWLGSETSSGQPVFMDELDLVCQELASLDAAKRVSPLVRVATIVAAEPAAAERELAAA